MRWHSTLIPVPYPLFSPHNPSERYHRVFDMQKNVFLLQKGMTKARVAQIKSFHARKNHPAGK